MCRSIFLLMTFLLVTALHGVAFSAAAEKPLLPLFEQYLYQAPKSSFIALPGVKEGKGHFAGDLLLPEVSFIGHMWIPRLEFKEDKLVRVSLMGSYSDALMERLTSFLRDNKFEALALLVDDRSLDFISFLKIDGTQALQKKMDEMLSSQYKRVTYAWFVTGGISREMKIMARNLQDFLMLAPSTTREAEVTLLHDDAGKQVMIFVDFTYPVLDVM